MKRVLIGFDVIGWCQERYALGIQRYAPPEYEVVIDKAGRMKRILGEASSPHAFDSALCLSPWYLKAEPATYALCASHGWMHDKFNPDDWQTRGVTRDRNARKGNLFRRAKGIIARNQILADYCRRWSDNVVCIPPGVDTQLFSPAGRKEPSEKIVVGWCGNIQRPKVGGNFKGYEDVWCPIKVALDPAKFETRELTGNFETALSKEAMADWYRSLDVFVCTASAEGTPNGPWESAACGCCVLSTNVGAVTDWEFLNRIGSVVPTYCDARSAAAAIINLMRMLVYYETHRDRMVGVGQECRRAVEQEYCYSIIAPRVLEFITQ